MGCGCCKEIVTTTEPEPSPWRAGGGGSLSPSTIMTDVMTPIPPPQRPCKYCGADVDGALLEGHEEICRVQHRKLMLSQAIPPPVPPEEPSIDSILCVICLDAPRAVAFVPCGHMCCCPSCASSMDVCPLCRGPVSGRLEYLTGDSICVCQTCGETLHPSLFEGHRETCAMRRRQEGKGVTVRGQGRPKCVVCRERNRDRAVLPCGHVAFCSLCVLGISECPVCCRKVGGVLALFT